MRLGRWKRRNRRCGTPRRLGFCDACDGGHCRLRDRDRIRRRWRIGQGTLGPPGLGIDRIPGAGGDLGEHRIDVISRIRRRVPSALGGAGETCGQGCVPAGSEAQRAELDYRRSPSPCRQALRTDRPDERWRVSGAGASGRPRSAGGSFQCEGRRRAAGFAGRPFLRRATSHSCYEGRR